MQTLRRFVVAGLAVLLLQACSSATTGKRFDSLAEFSKAFPGFAVLGRFNEGWPATLTRIDSARDQITFTVPGKGRQSYPGYRGYELKAVFLRRADGKTAVIVLRSKQRR